MEMARTSSVGSAQQDQRNVGLRCAESLGYLGLGHGSSQGSNLRHFLFSEEFCEAQAEPHVDGMLFVQPVVNPFKIIGNGIRLVPVNMIDMGQIVGIGDESKRDESVDVDGLHQTVSAQVDLRVSDFVDPRFEDLSVAPSQAIPENMNSVQAANTAEIADFVNPFEVNNASPFLNRHLGSYARKAHFIVVSDATQGG